MSDLFNDAWDAYTSDVARPKELSLAVEPVQSAAAPDQRPASGGTFRFARSPAYYRSREFPCVGCDAPITEETEFQCGCGDYFCGLCFETHDCKSSEICTECGARFPSAMLTLAPCACDAEWCDSCGAKHVCGENYNAVHS